MKPVHDEEKYTCTECGMIMEEAHIEGFSLICPNCGSIR